MLLCEGAVIDLRVTSEPFVTSQSANFRVSMLKLHTLIEIMSKSMLGMSGEVKSA